MLTLLTHGGTSRKKAERADESEQIISNGVHMVNWLQYVFGPSDEASEIREEKGGG